LGTAAGWAQAAKTEESNKTESNKIEQTSQFLF
jgi:hypothetical protein